MRIQVLSDLHLEFHNPIPPLVEGVDVIVCAGDLAPLQVGALFYAAKEWAAAHILYVPGNHEYYNTDIEPARRMLAKQCRMLGITLLDPSATTIDGIRFIGATLWTDFRVEGLDREAAAHAAVGEGMSDFTGAIQHGRRRYTTFESARRHQQERACIEAELAAASKRAETTVVITHHAPTARSIALHFKGHSLNAAFASNLEDIIERYQPALWIHGHMHDAVDLQIGRTRVLCNPAGYEAEKNTTRGYNPSLCVEITAS